MEHGRGEHMPCAASRAASGPVQVRRHTKRTGDAAFAGPRSPVPLARGCSPSRSVCDPAHAPCGPVTAVWPAAALGAAYGATRTATTGHAAHTPARRRRPPVNAQEHSAGVPHVVDLHLLPYPM